MQAFVRGDNEGIAIEGNSRRQHRSELGMPQHSLFEYSLFDDGQGSFMTAHLRRRSSPESMLVVPGQGTGIRMLADIPGRLNPLTVKRVVVFAVVKLFPNAAADLEVKVGRHCHIAGVEQAVDVATQEEPVSPFMLATFAIGTDVCRLQRR